jgi:hypothetical protein
MSDEREVIGLSPEEVAARVADRRRKERLEELGAITQTALGVVAALAGLGMAGWTVIHPHIISGVMAGGAFVTGIIVAVPAARPWVIRILERLPGVKDLPDDGEG